MDAGKEVRYPLSGKTTAASISLTNGDKPIYFFPLQRSIPYIDCEIQLHWRITVERLKKCKLKTIKLENLCDVDVSFSFCIFVRPVLSVTNEGREGFHQRLIERQARGEWTKQWKSPTMWKLCRGGPQRQGKLRHWSEAEKRKGGTPGLCCVDVDMC